MGMNANACLQQRRVQSDVGAESCQVTQGLSSHHRQDWQSCPYTWKKPIAGATRASARRAKMDASPWGAKTEPHLVDGDTSIPLCMTKRREKAYENF